MSEESKDNELDDTQAEVESDEDETKAIAKRQSAAAQVLFRYRNTRKALHQAIRDALPPIKDADGNPDDAAAKLTIKAGTVLDALADRHVHWAIAIHWLYTVCNPKIFPTIEDKDGNAMLNPNPKSSPVYEAFATDFPPDRFGELDALDDTEDGLVPHREKVVADTRYVDKGIWDFGTAWDNDGVVVKQDADGHPILDGFSGWVADAITALQAKHLSKTHNDGHFQAFMLAHSRDTQAVERDATGEHTATHIQAYLDLGATKLSVYQMMEAFGTTFDDFTYTFKWIASLKPASQDSKDVVACNTDKAKRIKAFLNTLSSLIANFQGVDPATAAGLQKYLVHQTKKATSDEKIPYSTKEVVSWLPDDPHETYESIANVYDNQVDARGVDAAVLRNLNSPFNRSHNSKQYAGKKNQNRRFTYRQIADLRSLGKKKPGSATFTGASQRAIVNLLMEWVRETNSDKPSMQVGEWPLLIHLAFDDSDADSLLSNQRFTDRMQSLIDAEIATILDDPGYLRHMQTFFITAKVGGIGKTFLATALAEYLTRGRKPHSPVAAPQKGITFDPFGNYKSELSSVLDELPGWAFAWVILKSLLEQEKLPDLPSRYHNKTPWAVKYTFITDVFQNGIAQYINDALQFAPGAGTGSDGYLKPDSNGGFMFCDDAASANNYLANLSQLIRRLPVWIEMAPTKNRKGFAVKVSVPNVRPGNPSNHYDYVHTTASIHRFDNLLLTPDTSQADVTRVCKTVISVIHELQTQAHVAFVADPAAHLDQLPGFIADNCDFKVHENRLTGEPTLVDEQVLQPEIANSDSGSDLSHVFSGVTALESAFVAFAIRNGNCPNSASLQDKVRKKFWAIFRQIDSLDDKAKPDAIEYCFYNALMIFDYLTAWNDDQSRLSETDKIVLMALRAGINQACLAGYRNAPEMPSPTLKLVKSSD